MATADVRVHELGFLRTQYFLAQDLFPPSNKIENLALLWKRR
jgi:hypothetical protein